MAYRSVGGDSDGLIIPELGVAPLVDSGTDLDDELPTPDGSPSTDVSRPVLGSTSPGAGAGSPGAWGFTGDGDAHSRPGCGNTRDSSGVPLAPDSGAVGGVPLVVASPARPAGGEPSSG